MTLDFEGAGGGVDGRVGDADTNVTVVIYVGDGVYGGAGGIPLEGLCIYGVSDGGNLLSGC